MRHPWYLNLDCSHACWSGWQEASVVLMRRFCVLHIPHISLFFLYGKGEIFIKFQSRFFDNFFFLCFWNQTKDMKRAMWHAIPREIKSRRHLKIQSVLLLGLWQRPAWLTTPAKALQCSGCTHYPFRPFHFVSTLSFAGFSLCHLLSLIHVMFPI